MKLRTIWTFPTLSLRERLSRTAEWAWIATADMLPQRLRYWVTLGEIGRATKDAPNVVSADVTYILRRLTR